MANKKISDLTALGATPAGADILPITDVSGTPTTKKVTVTNLMGAAPVQSVAGRTGAVTLSNTDVSGLGTAATKDVGTSNGNVVELDSTGLPAVDGSQLTNVSGTDATKLAIASNLSDLNNAGTARTNLGLGTAATTASSDYATAAQGALADSATQPGDLGTAAALNVGTADTNVVQLSDVGGTVKLPAVDGSQLLNLPGGSVDGTQVTSTGETGGSKFLREDGDGTCSFQTVPITDENLRGTDNPHIGAFPNQSLKVLDSNPPGTALMVANATSLKFVVGASADVFVVKGTSDASRLAEASELPAFIISKDSGEPDIELTDSDGEVYSVVNGDSDTKGANDLPIRQGFNLPDIGAFPATLLISGGTIS